MTKADKIFKDCLRQILAQDWENDNRATWEDGSQVMTKRVFGVVNRYNLAEEFPALTIRKTMVKGPFKELDWIFRQCSSKVEDLGLSIWDAWADENGTVGKSYGYQAGKTTHEYATQIDYIIGEIKKNPTSRRLIIELWNVDDLPEMMLPPCVHHAQFSVQKGKLNILVKQRSCDTLVAMNYDVVEYAILTHMIARECGLEVGELMHVIGDMHIYDKHAELAREILNREELLAPTFWLNPDKKDFYSFKIDDVKLIYTEQPIPVKLEVAI